MIRSFADSDTERVWNGERCRRFPAEIDKAARRKLRMLDAAVAYNDLKNPSSNRPHELKRGFAGQHSISLNK